MEELNETFACQTQNKDGGHNYALFGIENETNNEISRAINVFSSQKGLLVIFDSKFVKFQNCNCSKENLRHSLPVMDSSKLKKRCYDYSFSSPAMTLSELAVFQEQFFEMGCQNIIRKTEAGKQWQQIGAQENKQG